MKIKYILLLCILNTGFINAQYYCYDDNACNSGEQCYNCESDNCCCDYGSNGGSDGGGDIIDDDGGNWDMGDLFDPCFGFDLDIPDDEYGCMDPNAANFNINATIDDGSCEYQNSCEDGYVIDCSGDGDCCINSWIGDGVCDGEEQQYGCDLTCYNNDGEDCEDSDGDNNLNDDCPLHEIYGNNCDFYVQDGEYTCEQLMYEYGFDCTGCSLCANDCPIHEAYGVNCDYYVELGYSCNQLETIYQFDCTGCSSCNDSEPVYGCTDESADNYNPEATNDDGSCLYNGCPGGNVPNCGEFSCVPSEYIGDGWCQDGTDSQYGFDLSCYDNDGGDCDTSHQDDFDIHLTLLSPHAGQHIDDYSNVEVRWEYEGEYTDSSGVYLSFNCSYKLGGGLIEVARGIPLESQSAVIDLSHDTYGEPIDAETIFANFKIIASDSYGNSAQAECSDYFIIGNPEGDINANYINEDDSNIVLDWAWIEDQTVVLTEEAIQSMQEFDYINIYDDNGINSDSCDGEPTGTVVLATIDLHNHEGSKTITLNCGFDYCDEGGSRIVGYLPNNAIKFSGGWYESNQLYSLMPHSPQMINDNMIFNNETFIINSFSMGDNFNSLTLHHNDRTWNQFNVYGKVTNHQGNSNRSCNNNGVCDAGESITDCFDDCCDIPGTGDNTDWCFLENISGVSNFVDNLTNGNYVPYIPNGTSSATFNYRVWLLDQDDNEVVKTIDTEIDYEADNLIAYQKDIAIGWNWFSLNVNTDDFSLDNIFANTTLDNSDYIKGQTLNSTYYIPGYQWYPNITLDTESAYLLNLNNDTEILYYGSYLDPNNTDIDIASGWNWISYVPQNELDIQSDNVLSSLNLQDGDYIKGQTVTSTYYVPGDQWYPDITLKPTEAYLLKVSNPGTLTYPNIQSSNNNDNINRIVQYVDDFNYHQFKYNGSITIKAEIDNIEIKENDEIRAYFNNELRGVAYFDLCPLNNKILATLMIYSNNEYENNLTFSYLNKNSGKEYSLNQSLNFEKDMILGNIYSPVILTNIQEPHEFILHDAYPNPFNPSTVISFDLKNNYNEVELLIYDINGRLVETLISANLNYGSHRVTWNANDLSSGIYLVKLISNNDIDIKKVMLIK